MLCMPTGPEARPILVVDDDPKIVRLVRTYLEREGYPVVEAAEGDGALGSLARQSPALVVLDLMIPGVPGLDVIRRARAAGDRTPIIVLSARGLTSDRIAGLEAGADDYLPKPFSPAELMLRVRRLLERSGDGAAPALRPPLVLRDLVVDRDRYEATVAGRPVALTPTSFRLLVVLLEAGGRVITRDGLLDAIYDRDDGAAMDRTIDAYVRRLRVQLGDDAERPRFIATVRGAGYRALVGHQ
jgi:two-component system, OmpR family, alkaline phosphatase synthesis response regulator PhoP